jgi:hypothetical protein
MAFTGDLEHLSIVDIIQLVHTTRKSGIFSVKADKGESRLVFSSGYIVGANHIDNSVRIGTVLVKTGVITIDDLKQALAVAKAAAKDRKPLMATLMEMGRLKREDALRGLKKLIEMSIVELMSWAKGTFTFDTDSMAFSGESGTPFGDSEQDLGVDAQMALMDALRIFDERERDRAKGKEVPAFEVLYADVLPGEGAVEVEVKIKEEHAAITADDLGLADLDHLEKKIPGPVSEMELFDPVAIHRQKIKELLAGFSSGEQEAFVSYLGRAGARKPGADAAGQRAGKAVVFFSGDELVRHSLMTLCNDEGIPVFSTGDEADLARIISQCLSSLRTPVVVFDSPVRSEGGLTEKKILSMRTAVMKKYPAVPVIQFASIDDADFFLQSYHDGVRSVFPKPSNEVRQDSYIHDTIQFLDIFRAYIKAFQERIDTTDRYVKELKDNIRSLREIANPSDAAMVMLAFVAEMFERGITFLVRPAELAGERAVGVSTEKNAGPTPADRLKISLAKPSVFREAFEKGLSYYGESGDETLKELFKQIGAPLSPAVVLLPLISDRKVVAIVYGDFGKKEASPIQLDILEILAQQVGFVLEHAQFRMQKTKASQK